MKTKLPCADLLHCPFCGSVAELTHTSGSYGYYAGKWGAGCTSCGVQTQAFDDEIYKDGKQVHMYEQAKADAIAIWNQRTATPSGVTVVFSIMDFIPEPIRTSVVDGTNTHDLTQYFQNAVNVGSVIQSQADSLANARDAARLDWFDKQCCGYGCEDIHEGNRWEIDGPFNSLRHAIDAGIKYDATKTKSSQIKTDRAPVERRDPPFDAIEERRSGIDRRQRVAPAKG